MDDASNRCDNHFRQRERTERKMAEVAASVEVQKIHLELAERYRALADMHEPPNLSQSSE